MMEFLEIAEEDDFDPPSYSKPGWIEFEILTIKPLNKYGRPVDGVYRYEIELIDADLDSAVFWIQEGIGFNYFLDQYIELDQPGKYRIEGIYGDYFRGDWKYGEDDDVDWYFDRVIRID